jgi:hypothetical protein
MTRYEKKHARLAKLGDAAIVSRQLSSWHRDEGYYSHKWAVAPPSIANVPQRPGSRSKRCHTV